MSGFAWGYDDATGPAVWADHFPAAKGQRQTPVDIDPAQAQYDASLKDKPLVFNYAANCCNAITNTGASAQVVANETNSTLTGGPLDDVYRLEQFHWHWGSADDRGSEHRVNGKMYASELHLVHWNTSKFKSFGDAASQDKGLAVVGVFIEVGDEHAGFAKIADALQGVRYSGDKEKFGEFDPLALLPANRDRYWTYEGSLTTPPCFESVSWVMFKDPVQLSEAQVNSLRSLYKGKSDSCGCIVDNFRPPLPLNDRVLRASFRKFFT